MKNINIWNPEQQEPTSLDDWYENVPPWRDTRIKQSMWSWRTSEVPEEMQKQRGSTWRGSGADLVNQVNSALWLRRPILVKGDPGIGKSSLAYSIAHQLGLGAVLRWEINSRSVLQDGLYEYRAVDHLSASQREEKNDISNHIGLGPLGTAIVGGALYPEEKEISEMSPSELKPRVLLIDEIDKSDYDLSNDLLHVLEEAEFSIPELRRSNDKHTKIHAMDEGRVRVSGSKVVSHCLPIVVMTSNNERDFPKAFLRRCWVIDLEKPSKEVVQQIILEHFKGKKEELSRLEQAFENNSLDDCLEESPAEALQTVFLKLQANLEDEIPF